jgi:uncharacterized membrane-anchored protein
MVRNGVFAASNLFAIIGAALVLLMMLHIVLDVSSVLQRAFAGRHRDRAGLVHGSGRPHKSRKSTAKSLTSFCPSIWRFA